jgi:hypothetical protein
MVTEQQPVFEEESLGRLAEMAMRDAVRRVIEEARQTNGVLVVWENGAVRHLRADELPPPVDQNL